MYELVQKALLAMDHNSRIQCVTYNVWGTIYSRNVLYLESIAIIANNKCVKRFKLNVLKWFYSSYHHVFCIQVHNWLVLQRLRVDFCMSGKHLRATYPKCKDRLIQH